MLDKTGKEWYNIVTYGFIRYIGVRALCNKTP